MAYSSIIANEALATPFDNKAAVRAEITDGLTVVEFLEHCYSHPQFMPEGYEVLAENIDPNNIVDYSNPVQIIPRNPSFLHEDKLVEEIEEYDVLPTTHTEIDDTVFQLINAYIHFHLWKGDFNSNKVYTLNGNAGTGKTTFINRIRYIESKKNWVILDVHNARSHVDWMADIRTTINNFNRAHAKVYGSVMCKIWEIIFQGINENGYYSLQIVNNNLVELSDNYRAHFADLYPSGRMLMNRLGSIIDETKDIPTRVEKAANLFKEHVNGLMGKGGDGLINALNILLLVLRCNSSDPYQKHIIVFDNFERFIGKDEIYNKDVDKIRLQLTSYIDNINKSGNCHKGIFKFVMAVRDSTARMCSVRLQASDSKPSNLDLSDWYDTEDIISKKMEWYAKKKINVQNSKLIKQIIGDIRECSDGTLTGLKLMIDPLFNNNKRLIIDFIGTMIELPSNRINISKYEELWNKNTPMSRFAARSIIRGMILHNFERMNDRFFEHLHTYSSKNDTNGLGDARKILTLLFNNIHSGRENEMPLSDVISTLFKGLDALKCWNLPEYAKSRKTISEVLFYMNSYNRRENDWIQFIDLQVKESSGSVSVKEADQLEKIIGEKMESFVIHLMPGGQAYLRHIVASFEFFSLRYSKNYIPLFAAIPTLQEIKEYKTINDLPCYEILNRVVNRAIACIGLLQKGEDTIKITLDKSLEGILHATRIVNHHKSYIGAFLKLLDEAYVGNSDFDEIAKNKLDKLIQEGHRLLRKYDNAVKKQDKKNKPSRLGV